MGQHDTGVMGPQGEGVQEGAVPKEAWGAWSLEAYWEEALSVQFPTPAGPPSLKDSITELCNRTELDRYLAQNKNIDLLILVEAYIDGVPRVCRCR